METTGIAQTSSTEPASPFNKGDKGKAPLSILRDFPKAREVISRILMQGADEYGRQNWRNVDDRERYISALDRHVDQYHNGEKFDTKSGHHHLAHAISNLFFLLELDLSVE